ncbi:restriction endonuclease subunit S [Amycolatopsis taiwanensis]|uniref:restriction endonuclease subunit S n=1 Tax=Amycolatopsis taiwanensis TaxID=342230 RepID=UPI00146FA899|nr:restriction endonuclease subunit S [Amycolatopsis taiwanensis]
MSLNLDKTSWKRVAFGDVVKNLNVTVKDPEAAGINRVIAMEHLDPSEVSISRWGNGADGTTFTRRVKPGQTLFGKRRAYQRKAAYAEFDAIISGDILVFEADKNQLLPELLPFLVQSDGFYDHALGTSAGSLSPRTNWRDLSNYKFDLPPIDEQKRLADLLWAAERHRTHLTHLASTLAPSYDTWIAEQIANFPRRLLGELIELQSGRPVPSELYGEGEFPLLRPGDMAPNGVTSWSMSSVRIPESFALNFSPWILEPGDLVINMTAQSLEDRFLGRVCRMHDKAFLNQRIGRIRSKSVDVDYDFLFLVLRSLEFTDWVARRSEGSKVKHMHWRHIEDYPFPTPDLAVQRALISKAAAWSSAIISSTAEIRSVRLLRSSILAAIFGVASDL